jgi:hypothetical protein
MAHKIGSEAKEYYPATSRDKNKTRRAYMFPRWVTSVTSPTHGGTHGTDHTIKTRLLSSFRRPPGPRSAPKRVQTEGIQVGQKPQEVPWKRERTEEAQRLEDKPRVVGLSFDKLAARGRHVFFLWAARGSVVLRSCIIVLS